MLHTLDMLHTLHMLHYYMHIICILYVRLYVIGPNHLVYGRSIFQILRID